MNIPTGEPYEVRITPEGLRHFDRLPDKIRHAALAALRGPIRENPRRLGKPLVGELAGLFSARRGDYRIIYSIDEAAKVVLVHRIQHRGDGDPRLTTELAVGPVGGRWRGPESNRRPKD